MKIKRWYYKNNYEDYNVLYENETYILVQNINTKTFSFGVVDDFGSFYGFPVNQSCLLKDECINILNRFIEIDERYNNKYNINTWLKMINKLKEEI